MKILTGLAIFAAMAVLWIVATGISSGTDSNEGSVTRPSSDNEKNSSSKRRGNSQIVKIPRLQRDRDKLLGSVNRIPAKEDLEQANFEYANLLEDLGVGDLVAEQILTEIALGSEELRSLFMTSNIYDFSKGPENAFNKEALERYDEIAPSFTPIAIIGQYLTEEQYAGYRSYLREKTLDESGNVIPFKDRFAELSNSQ